MRYTTAVYYVPSLSHGLLSVNAFLTMVSSLASRMTALILPGSPRYPFYSLKAFKSDELYRFLNNYLSYICIYLMYTVCHMNQLDMKLFVIILQNAHELTTYQWRITCLVIQVLNPPDKYANVITEPAS